ncbi:MAG: MmgE/PrpD family protein [Hyphomicrobiales bacterium]|nr:MAG: MmgE/PrpD family protein [Hyphomicrobiales bacterium]
MTLSAINPAIATDELAASEPSKALAQFVIDFTSDQMTDALRHESKRALMNYFAVALVGAGDPTIKKAYSVLSKFAGKPTARIIGRNGRTDSLNAAFFNAASANVFDFDDTHFPTIIHPTAPVAAALFALCEQRQISGEEFMQAFILGVEAECRIGNAVSPDHYKRGWHITATCGVFGAAIAVGKIIGLTGQQMVWALGSASAQAGGLVENLGYMAKSMGVGNAARNGLLSALLAKQDFDGPPRPLEGERGFLHVTGENPDYAAITQGLGERWEVFANTYKPYPCGVVLNPVIEACLNLHTQAEFAIDEIEEITVSGHSLLGERADRPTVASGRESQVSAQHAVAVSLLFGKAGIDQFSDQAVAAPAVLNIAAKVQITENPSISIEGIDIKVRLKSGKTISELISASKGCAANPLTDRDLENKLTELASHRGGCDDPKRLIDAVWAIDSVEDMSALLDLAVPTP